MSTKTNLNHVVPRRGFLLGCTAFVVGCASLRIAPASASHADHLTMQQAM